MEKLVESDRTEIFMGSGQVWLSGINIASDQANTGQKKIEYCWRPTPIANCSKSQLLVKPFKLLLDTRNARGKNTVYPPLCGFKNSPIQFIDAYRE